MKKYSYLATAKYKLTLHILFKVIIDKCSRNPYFITFC